MDVVTKRRMQRLTWGTILCILAVFIFASLVSFAPIQSSFFTFPPQLGAGNYLERIGVFVATYLFLGLGLVAFLLPVSLFWLGLKQFPRQPRGSNAVRAVSIVLGLAGLCTLLYFAGADETTLRFGGGLVGLALSHYLSVLLGWFGGVLAAAGMVAVAVLLNVDFASLRRRRALRREVAEQTSARPRGRSLRRVEQEGLGTRRPRKAPSHRKLSPVRNTTQSGYCFPPLDLLDAPSTSSKSSTSEVHEAGLRLQQTLQDFGVEVEIGDVKEGPAITRYEVRLAPGIRVSKLMNLANDVALSLAVPNVRIEVPVSGKPLVGIEVPKKKVTFVCLRQLLAEPEFRRRGEKLLFPLGKDIAGDTVWVDLESLPHLLIGGSTGSGKSVCINSILVSLLYRTTPEETKLLLIDPKTVELADYAEIPHLIAPPVKDFKAAATALDWVVAEMMTRYDRLNRERVRNITGYNQARQGEELMPYLVVVIDELADLMMLAGSRLEKTLCRIAQLGRATGIHLIVATQRPSVDVITGLIKANFPSRLSFSVASQVDSRTVLDTTGAEKLLGNGDMLFSPVDSSQLLRIQGSYTSPGEVKRVVAFIRDQKEPVYTDIVGEVEAKQVDSDADQDELFAEARELVLTRGKASTSYLQRRLAIGYNRAARIMEQLEQQGIVGPARGSKPREVLVRPDTGAGQEGT